MSSIPMYPSKSEAIATGALFYSSDKPCRKGHESKRYTKTGHCFYCCREKAVEWQHANRERHNEHVAAYAKRKPQTGATATKKHRNKMKGDPEWLMRQRLSTAKTRAKQKGLAFDLTLEYLISIIPEDHKCPVFGTDFDFTGEDEDRIPSLDRIDNDKGYVQGNVWLISWRANNVKKDSSLNELKMLVEAIESKLLS